DLLPVSQVRVCIISGVGWVEGGEIGLRGLVDVRYIGFDGDLRYEQEGAVYPAVCRLPSSLPRGVYVMKDDNL
ncbi:hypothetical protein, partial [Bacillus safensis]|uniref:hypothetical protein n=1 Tax=Bacillus safensis TaxID=561879 RepID=UPI001C931065